MHDARVAMSLHLHSPHMEVRRRLCGGDSLLLDYAGQPKSHGLTLSPDGIVLPQAVPAPLMSPSSSRQGPMRSY